MKMLVIADDLTGAAEIAGIGMRYGLRTRLDILPETDTDADLTVIDSGSRSVSDELARQSLGDLARRVASWPRAANLYLKTDSVLRGHPRIDIETFLSVSGKQSSLWIPANPSRARTICQGRYFIHGRPLSQTEFVHDPECPRTTDDVIQLAGPGCFPISYIPCGKHLPEAGIAIGEARTDEDLHRWAKQCAGSALLAGGADLFSAWIENHGFGCRASLNEPRRSGGKRTLVLCGSTSDYSRHWRQVAMAGSVPVVEISPRTGQKSEGRADFLSIQEKLLQSLSAAPMVLLGVASPTVPGKEAARSTAFALADLLQGLLRENLLEELWVEGGATASAIFQAMDWRSFEPEEELAAGVVRLRSLDGPAPQLILKPGSYPWPESLFALRWENP